MTTSARYYIWNVTVQFKILYSSHIYISYENCTTVIQLHYEEFTEQARNKFATTWSKKKTFGLWIISYFHKYILPICTNGWRTEFSFQDVVKGFFFNILNNTKAADNRSCLRQFGCIGRVWSYFFSSSDYYRYSVKSISLLNDIARLIKIKNCLINSDKLKFVLQEMAFNWQCYGRSLLEVKILPEYGEKGKYCTILYMS